MVIVKSNPTPGYLLSWGTPMSIAGCTAAVREQRERIAGATGAGTAHARTLDVDVPTNPSAPSGWIT
ncbi:hypothetical protein [Alloactinosynnema sp. L-07]|uniref:hypothetical protein n=1 Tax=Alloactinosynnema sp. L-07 TaxID=1653480 RepID=UPI0012FCA86C|nr:hypothetical protein [Alloactinosynnema sp. L-07]